MLQCYCDDLSSPPPVQPSSVRPPFLLWPTALLVCAQTPLTLAAPAQSHAPMATLCPYVSSYLLIVVHISHLWFLQGESSIVCLASGQWSANTACDDTNACLGNPCAADRSTCTDVPASSHTGVNAGKPQFYCTCLPDFSGTPGPDGMGCGMTSCTCVLLHTV